MTASDTENPATGQGDDPEPTHATASTGTPDPKSGPAPTGAWDPNTPPPAPTGAWDPNTPPAPTGAWDPNTPPAPTGAWDPNTPPAPTGAWDPNTPPAPTGAWDPNTPPAPAGAWDPNTPPQQQPRPHTGNGFAPPTPGIWIRNRVITQLWSSSTRPGVWAFIAGLGWKQLAAVETGRSPLTGLAVLAKANGLTVSFRENAYGQIDQLLV